jgi:hypothetical protein
VLSCGHLTCVDCNTGIVIQRPALCPICRKGIDIEKIMTVTIQKTLPAPKSRPVNHELENSLVVEKFGSKVYEFVKFALQTMRKNPESKIILFIQFTRFPFVI